MLLFIGIFGFVVFLIVDWLGNETGNVKIYATLSFVLGSITSMLCGFIGMKIAVAANYRTTYKAISSLEEAF
jgi:Na+/H+-translocating membrane pyrophosphatase